MNIFLTSKISKSIQTINLFLSRFSGRWVKLLTVTIIVAILVQRGGERVTNPQLWAEDGSVFFQDAYNLSFWQALLTPYAGYFLTFPRLLAEIAMLFRLQLVPTIFVIISLITATGCCSLFLLDNFSHVVPNLFARGIFCILFAALPASDEVLLRLANIQWYLGIAFMLLMFMPLPKHLIAKFGYVLVWVLAVISAPISIIFIPCLLIKSCFERKGRITLLFSSVTMIFIVFLIYQLRITSQATTDAPSPLTLIYAFINVFAYQVLAPAIMGSTGVSLVLAEQAYITYLLYIPFLTTILIVGIIAWQRQRWSEFIVLLFLCYCMVASVSLALLGRPSLVQGAQFIGNIRGGERYYVLPIASLYLATICGVYQYLGNVRWLVLIIMFFCLLLLPIRLDFSASQVSDWQWETEVKRIELAETQGSSTIITVPISPYAPWAMYLRVPTSFSPSSNSVKFTQKAVVGHFDGTLLDRFVETPKIGQQRVRATGWALERDGTMSAKRVLIVDKETHTILARTHTSVLREDAYTTTNKVVALRSGWDVFFATDQLVPGVYTIVAYVYNEDTREAFPIQGQSTITVTATLN